MEVATFHVIWTIVILVVFLGIVFWAWSGKRKKSFDEAARLPLEDDDTASSSTTKENRHG